MTTPIYALTLERGVVFLDDGTNAGGRIKVAAVLRSSQPLDPERTSFTLEVRADDERLESVTVPPGGWRSDGGGKRVSVRVVTASGVARIRLFRRPDGTYALRARARHLAMGSAAGEELVLDLAMGSYQGTNPLALRPRHP